MINNCTIITKHVTQLDTQTQYIPGQHDSSINIQSPYTHTAQFDFMRIVATKEF